MTQTMGVVSNPAPSPLVSWQPGPDIVDHSGDPADRTTIYFQAPPPEIGQIISARSNLRPNERGKSPGVRLGIAGTVAAIFLGLGYYGSTETAPRNANIVLFGGVVAAIIAFLAIWFSTGFKRFCNYVGVNGVARYEAQGDPLQITLSKVFPFPAAAELRTEQTRHYYNGVYTQTTYNFNWTDHAGARVFNINGNYRNKDGRPKSRDGFWFARSAEVAWNNYQLGWVAQQVETMGFAHFNLTGGNFVRVGPGFFEFGMKGEVARIGVDEIKSLNLSQGQFHITHKDAKWFSRKGKFNFSYASMANAQLFLLAMEKLTGYRFGE